MKIDITELKNASLIAISGRIDSDTSPEVARAFQSVQDQGQYNIIVDMSGLEYISSATLRALMAAQRASKRTQRGEVTLLRVRRISTTCWTWPDWCRSSASSMTRLASPSWKALRFLAIHPPMPSQSLP